MEQGSIFRYLAEFGTLVVIAGIFLSGVVFVFYKIAKLLDYVAAKHVTMVDEAIKSVRTISEDLKSLVGETNAQTSLIRDLNQMHASESAPFSTVSLNKAGLVMCDVIESMINVMKGENGKEADKIEKNVEEMRQIFSKQLRGH